MNNDLMLVPRAQLELILEQLNHAATAFKGAKTERDALRKLLAAAPAAQAVDEDSERRKQAFGKWYAANPYEELTNATVAWMAYHEGARMERAALAAPVQIEQEPVRWGSPKTVRQLIRQLQTLDPELETVALYRLPDGLGELSGKVKQGHISTSYERMDGIWLAPFKSDGRLVLAFWAKLDPRDEPDGQYVIGTAPVRAVRLPEQHGDRCDSSEAEAYQNGWNACLDAVSQLNQSPNQKEIKE